MTTWTITEKAVTYFGGQAATQYRVHPEGTEYSLGEDHYNTDKRESAEAFAAARTKGMTYSQAERLVLGAPQLHEELSDASPATSAQIARLRTLLRTADLEDIEGSIPLPDLTTVTKADASWWIGRLTH